MFGLWRPIKTLAQTTVTRTQKLSKISQQPARRWILISVTIHSTRLPEISRASMQNTLHHSWVVPRQLNIGEPLQALPTINASLIG
ncbi:hypothetical protein D3C87_1502390 [compost metagenome]